MASGYWPWPAMLRYGQRGRWLLPLPGIGHGKPWPTSTIPDVEALGKVPEALFGGLSEARWFCRVFLWFCRGFCFLCVVFNIFVFLSIWTIYDGGAAWSPPPGMVWSPAPRPVVLWVVVGSPAPPYVYPTTCSNVKKRLKKSPPRPNQ